MARNKDQFDYDSYEEDSSKSNMSISDALSKIKKQFKKINPDIISDPKRMVDFIPSGDFIFDLVTNCRVGGGFPRSRISEIFGEEHSGKTSLLLSAFAGIQKKGGLGILLDFEQSWEPYYARTTFGLVEDEKTFHFCHCI